MLSAEHEGRRPRAFGHQPLEGHADRQRGDNDQADRQQPDGPHTGPEIAPRGQQCRLIQDGRQHEHEDELRIKIQLWQARDEAECAAADHQRDRIGKAEMARHPPQRNCAQQQEQDDLEQFHALRPGLYCYQKMKQQIDGQIKTTGL